MFENIDKFYEENKEKLIKTDPLRPTKSIPRDIMQPIKKFRQEIKDTDLGTKEDIAITFFNKEFNDTVSTNIRVMTELGFFLEHDNKYTVSERFIKFKNSNQTEEEYIYDQLIKITKLEDFNMIYNSIICALREIYKFGRLINYPDSFEKFKNILNNKDEKIKLQEVVELVYGFKGRGMNPGEDYSPNASYRIKTILTNLKFISSETFFSDVTSNVLTEKGYEFLRRLNKNLAKSNESKLNLSYQRIIYGAPGTGKSYNLQKEIEENFEKDNVKRVTFYDGYTYGQFVGAYKPVMYKDSNDKKEIGYEFVAGPLLKKILNAYKYPEQNFIIVIEEINRAKADRVFGDIFQLLDRNLEGDSEYSIALSREQENYFEDNLDEVRYLETIARKKGLYLPNNLYIWATMNSADQGVYPMDTAFKRRWSFKYTPLNNLKTEYKIRIDGELYSWDIYRNLLNDILGENGITEDRLIAPFFLKDKDFDHVTKELKEEIYLNKFLMYLFEDVLKHNKRLKNLIFEEKNLNFYKIFSNIKNANIYLEDFKSSLIEKSNLSIPKPKEE
ncbi:AAA family ATPase [Cetobacterium sp.]|uniref:AAA family ATPase n=1 Tax=Cetobacterium sp. TaxID=2071632 RepID=UPI003F418CA2